MDYFNLAFIAIIIVQSFVFRKILNSKASKKEIESLKNEVNLSVKKSTSNVKLRVEDTIAKWNSDWRTQMVELENFCHQLATSQREETLNVLTKNNDLQKRLVNFASTVLENDKELKEIKKDIILVARNPSKARRKFSKDE